MRTRPTPLLLATLVFATAGCISQSEWEKYNKEPGEACSSSDECGFCTEDSPEGCRGPTADGGICIAGVCRTSRGEIGLNCNAENAGTCDYTNCIFASSSQYGICSKSCETDSCPGERTACVESARTGGGVIRWCAQKCVSTDECDSNSTCQNVPAGYQVCFPS